MASTLEAQGGQPAVMSLLVRRLVAQLCFARCQIERLDRNAYFWPESGHGVIRLRDKVATEAALLLLLARRVERAHPGIARANDALAAVLLPEIRSERLHGLILRQPQVAATLGAGSLFLAAAGHPDPRFGLLIEEALDQGFGECVERLPYRQLDQLWTRNLTASPPRPIEPVLAQSILMSRAHPLFMTEADAYAVTHAIFYASDFGAAPPPNMLPAIRTRDMVRSGIAWHIVSEDFDLLCEYLMCALCLGDAESAAARFGLHVVDSIWSMLDFLPGPTFDAARYRALSGAEADAYACEQMYHTNFVAGMLCALRITQGEHPADVKPTDELASQLETMLALGFAIAGTTISIRSPWFTSLDAAPLSDAELLPLLWEAFAIEAARRGDLQAMEALAKFEPSPPSPTGMELRFLLARLQRAELVPRIDAGTVLTAA
jgi:hypothetical protein